MKGLPPERYGVTLDEIGLLVAYARRDNRVAADYVRSRFLVSLDQAEDWVNEAKRAGVVPDHSKLTRYDDPKNLKRARRE